MEAAAIVIGGSAGAFESLNVILPGLSPEEAPPVIVVVHLPPDAGSGMRNVFSGRCRMKVQEAEDKMDLEPGTIYFAPPGYHLLVERSRCLALSLDPPVHFSRPSIDVLFHSASAAIGDSLVGILLSGANADGAEGLARIHAAGGQAIVQDPETSQSREMPRAGLQACPAALVRQPAEIATWISGVRHGG